jgi:hypothetical protein
MGKQPPPRPSEGADQAADGVRRPYQPPRIDSESICIPGAFETIVDPFGRFRAPPEPGQGG